MMKNSIYVLAFLMLMASIATAQEKSEFKVSITKNGETLLDTIFSSENEADLAHVLFKSGSKLLPKTENKQIEWVQGDIVVKEGHNVRILKLSEEGKDSLVKEIVIKESPKKIVFTEEIGENAEEIVVNGAQKKVIWVTEESEEIENGEQIKKIVIKSTSGGEDPGNVYFFNSGEENEVFVKLDVEELEKSERIEKQVIIKKTEKGAYVFEMELNNGKNSISMKSMNTNELGNCKIESNEAFNPAQMHLKSSAKDLEYELSFETTQKDNISLSLFNENGKEIQKEEKKKADKFSYTLKFPEAGNYKLLLKQGENARLYNIKLE